ncbi:MAG: alpha-ribazole phosphatase family protein [Pedobacter sp.]|nr:alpha-ribazole phosphatase family protein [Pedobacter sp.]
MPLHLIRHTQPAVPPGLCYGRLDVALADSFSDELASLRTKLSALGASHYPVISSPSTRCLHLAQSLCAETHDNAQNDARLMELDFGDWEGKAWSEIDSPEARHWGDHWQTARCPNGESLADLLARLRDCWQALPANDLLVISHAGPLRASLHLLTGLSLQQAFVRPIAFGEIITLPGNPLPLRQNPLGHTGLSP